MIDLPTLPVSERLADLRAALEAGRSAVLVAPPGAGKTTLVPLALLDADWIGGAKILLLEPRRVAARAAARRMAALLGEDVGQTVGYAMRMESRQSARTRILVVTESVLTRMILDDPELSGIAAVLFDEFHERSLDGDFGLALALDVQSGLRPDLRVVVMSATLDGARVAKLLGEAPVIESAGRAFPVSLRYRERAPGGLIEDAMAKAILDMLAEERGSILAFLPGRREIDRTAERLAGRLPAIVDVTMLHGQLSGAEQDAAIRPAPAGRRKVVLATAIAETSITIEDVRVVIDSGLSRLPRYEPSTGLTRLDTVRVSRAAADQRAGRAGRTAPGVALRLWREEQTAALPPFAPPEILDADLSSLVLDCAAFGVADPRMLRFLDPPPLPALTEARALLRTLDALDDQDRLTKAGDAIRALALPVRFAHMVVAAKDHALDAARLAVLLTERGFGGNDADLDRRMARFATDRSPRANATRQLADRLARAAGSSAKNHGIAPGTVGSLLLHAFPDRVAIARGARGRFVLANGRGAAIDATDPLAAERFLIIADLQGIAENSRIAAAAAVTEAEIRAALATRVETVREVEFDRAKGALRLREIERLGAIKLVERMLPAPNGPDADEALIAAVRAHGPAILPWTDASRSLRQRLGWLHATQGEPWPDVGDRMLVDRLDAWLRPFLTGVAAFSALPAETLVDGLKSLVPSDLARRIDKFAPARFEVPTGSSLAIDYSGENPTLRVRVQELFGLTRHPAIADGKVPLTLELLSPAHRPIQTTRDLPGFWQGSWADVRADMRGRYPKHVWPEDPLAAKPTTHAKPRGT